jgi:hypothetical protein
VPAAYGKVSGHAKRKRQSSSSAQPVVNTRMIEAYDCAAAKAAVDRCLGEY